MNENICWSKTELKNVAEWMHGNGYLHDDVGLYKPIREEAQRAVLPKNRWRNFHNNTATLAIRAAMKALEQPVAKPPVIEKRRPKVFWRVDELQVIAAEMLRRGYKPDSPTILSGIRDAQTKVLPVERHRPVGCMDHAEGVIMAMRLLEPVVERAVDTKPVVDDQPPVDVTQTAVAVDAVGVALGQYVANSVLAAVQAEVNTIVEAMKQEIQRQLSPSGSIHKFERPVTRNRKPTVLIAGLLPSQAGYISQEFGDVFDLRFFDASGNLQQLRDMAKVDYAFTFTGKVSHGVEEAIQSKGTEIRRCPGGMTMLREKLTQLYVNGKEEAA